MKYNKDLSLNKKPQIRALLLASVVIAIVLLPMIVAGYLFPSQAPTASNPAELFANVLGSKIRYKIRDGKEPTLILLHGFGGRLNEWGKVQANLSPNRSISLDLIGFGGSDRPGIRYSLDELRRYLQAFMKDLKIDKAILVGRSMGASIAAYTAADSGDNIVGVVLIAPSGYPGSLTPRKPLNWFYTPGWLNSLSMLVVNNAFYRSLFPDSLASQALGVTSTYNDTFAESLRNIRQPTLLAWSPGDKTTPYRFHTEYLSRIKNIEFLSLPENVGHVTVRTYPEGTAVFINNFAARIQ